MACSEQPSDTCPVGLLWGLGCLCLPTLPQGSTLKSIPRVTRTRFSHFTQFTTTGTCGVQASCTAIFFRRSFPVAHASYSHLPTLCFKLVWKEFFDPNGSLVLLAYPTHSPHMRLLGEAVFVSSTLITSRMGCAVNVWWHVWWRIGDISTQTSPWWLGLRYLPVGTPSPRALSERLHVTSLKNQGCSQ